jgi:hypothetical protein
MTKEPSTAPKQTAKQLLLVGDLDYKAPSAMLFCQTTSVTQPQVHRSAHAKSLKYDENVLSQAGNGKINEDWILLDSESTCDVFYNPKFLNNIQRTKDGRKSQIHCNAGIVIVQTVGDLPGYGTVWFYPDGIANILSLALVQKKFRVTYDSGNGNKFVVHDRLMRRFTMSERGLFYCNMKQQQGNVLLNQATTKQGGDGISTVDKNKGRYSTRDMSRANNARRFQETTGASLQTILDIVDCKLLPNCPITRIDIKMAEDIYGTSIAHLKGKTVRKKGQHVTFSIATLPIAIANKYKLATLCGNIFYVNSIRFFSTISRHIHFRTAAHIKDAKLDTLNASLKAIRDIDLARGFKVNVLHMDGQFEPLRLRAAALGMHLNVVSNEEHVPEIERSIRVVKERVRSVHATLPFKRIPALFLIELIAGCLF